MTPGHDCVIPCSGFGDQHQRLIAIPDSVETRHALSLPIPRSSPNSGVPSAPSLSVSPLLFWNYAPSDPASSLEGGGMAMTSIFPACPPVPS